MKTINLTEKEFVSRVADIASGKEWKYLGDKPAIVDFYATWCRPCQTTARVLDELAKVYNGEIYIYKVDIEKEVGLSQAFGIHSIPTLLLIPIGGTPKILQGAVPKKDLIKAINRVLLENVEV
jgi:thioredoxin